MHIAVGAFDRDLAARMTARMDRLPPTKTVWRLIGLLSLAFFFEIYDLLLTGSIAPGLVSSGILTPTTKGLFGTTGIGAFVAALFSGLTLGTWCAGVLNERFGRRAIFTYSLLGFTFFSVVMAFQYDAVGLLVSRFFVGIGLGVEIVTIGAYIAELVPKRTRGAAFACSQMVGFSSAPICAGLAYLLVPIAPFGLAGWRWLVLIGATSALAAWYIRLRLPESPRWLLQQGRIAEAEAIVRDLELKCERESGKPLPPPQPAEAATEDTSSFIEALKPPYRARTIMMATFNTFQSMGFYGFANWVPTLLIARGINVSQSLYYTALIALAAPLGPALGILIGERIERKWLIVLSAAVVALMGSSFAYIDSASLLVMVGVILTLGTNTMSFSYHAYQNEIFPTRIRAKAVGFVYSFSRMSAIFNGFIIAFILREFGVPGVFAFITGAMLVVVFVITVFGPKTANRSLEEISK
jgi:MFS transporter, putative metabolite:H+ symporter